MKQLTLDCVLCHSQLTVEGSDAMELNSEIAAHGWEENVDGDGHDVCVDCLPDNSRESEPEGFPSPEPAIAEGVFEYA